MKGRAGVWVAFGRVACVMYSWMEGRSRVGGDRILSSLCYIVVDNSMPQAALLGR